MELNLHIRVFHEEVKEWACQLCTKFFKEHDGLAAHMYLHHMQGVFTCNHENCTYSASYQFEVCRHYVQAHCQYTCPFEGCGKTFRYKNVLETHQRSHTGVKPFRCAWPQGCYFSCTDRSSIVKHIRTQHFKLPRSKKTQRELNIVDNRNPSDYIEINQPLVTDELSTNSAAAHQNLFHSRSFPQESKRRYVHHPLRLKHYRCKWESCTFMAEHKFKVVKHIREMHSRHNHHSQQSNS